MELEKVHILAIGAHPDDVELSCSGTLMKAIDAGKKVGILDLTRGELGTRGSAELRIKEAENARKLIGASFRINLGMKDGFFSDDEVHQLSIIEVIRACRPQIVLVNAPRDRHPDHAKGAKLEQKACFLSGLRRIETKYNGQMQEAWRPRLVMNYIQDFFIEPHIVVDISGYWDRKMDAIMSFGSQFYDPNSNEPQSAISSEAFLDVLKGKAQTFGRYAGFDYGEGFVADRPIGVGSAIDLF